MYSFFNYLFGDPFNNNTIIILNLLRYSISCSHWSSSIIIYDTIYSLYILIYNI